MKKIINIVILISAMICLNSCTIKQGLEFDEIKTDYESYKLIAKTDEFTIEFYVVGGVGSKINSAQLCEIIINEEITRCIANRSYNNSLYLSSYHGEGELYKSSISSYDDIRSRFVIKKENDNYNLIFRSNLFRL